MKNTFSNKVNQFESPVPADMFDKIMDKKKKKKGIPPWYWVMATFAFTLLLGIGFSLTSTKKQITNNKTLEPSIQIKQSSPQTNTYIEENKEELHSTNHSKLAKISTANVKVFKNINEEATKTQNEPSLGQENVFNFENRRTVFEIKTPQIPSKSGTLSPPKPLTNKAIPTKAIQITQALPLLQNPLLFEEEPNFQAPDCYGFTGKKGVAKLFIEALYSPEYAKSILTSRKAEFNQYRKNRINSEEDIYSYSAQFGIGIKTRRGIVLRTGLNYSNHQTRFYKSDPSYTKITTVKIYDANGNYLRTDTKTEIGTWEVQQYNKHQYYDIPMTVGYITNFENFNVGFNVGAQFNIKSESSGRFFSSDNQMTSFLISQANPNSAYLNKITTQGIANLVITYSLGEHFRLVLSPHAKYTPKSITAKDYPIIEKILTTGLWAGARYQF